MSVVEPGSDRARIIARVRAILMRPEQAWDEIDAEETTVGGLYSGYAAPLAAISALCGFVGMALFGAGLFGFTYRPGLVEGLTSAVMSFVAALLGAYVLAVIIDLLAPKFDGTGSRIQALKLAVYSATPAWVAGVFGLIPTIGGLAAIVGAIYGLYVLYKGLPKLMKAPEEKALPYFGVVVVCMIVVAIVFGALSASVRGFGGPFGMGHRQEAASITIPGDHTIDLRKLEGQAERAKAAMAQIESGQAPESVDPDLLKAYLPATAAGYARTGVSASSGEVAGIKGSGAKATYARGDARIELSVTDIGAAGALAGLMGSFNVKSSQEEGDHYEKVAKVDGRMTQESYDRSSRHGEYSVMVGDQFMVQADGDGASVDELKAAVRAVDFAALETLAAAE